MRATTCIATAVDAGASRVVPVETVEEARAAAREMGALLCGERSGVPPVGFDLGNSPVAYDSSRVAGRDLVFTTTNGTRAMRAVHRLGVSCQWLACFRNLRAVVETLLDAVSDTDDASLLIACAGRQGRVSMDDAWCAGHLVDRLITARPASRLSDGAQAARRFGIRMGRPSAEGLAQCGAGQALIAAGLRGDLVECARVDDLQVAPVRDGGAFVKGGEEEGI